MDVLEGPKYVSAVDYLMGKYMDKYCCVKSVRIRSFCGPCFPKFGLNTKICKANFSMQSECGKIWARKNPNTDTFDAMYLSMNVFLVLLRLPSGKLGSVAGILL